MNYFNAQRDNIFASSSKYDIVQLKRTGRAQYHHSGARNTGKLSARRLSTSQTGNNHHSYPGSPPSRRNSLSNGSGKTLGQRKSAKPSYEQEDAELAASGYGFCHHCKQVKSKYLLARCNYNSDKMGHTVPASYTVRDVKIYNSKYIGIPLTLSFL